MYHNDMSIDYISTYAFLLEDIRHGASVVGETKFN
jgi:hypothetical protein